MLELAGLSRAFGSLRVIDRLDFTVEAGEILGILGPTAPANRRCSIWSPACCRQAPGASASKGAISPA